MNFHLGLFFCEYCLFSLVFCCVVLFYVPLIGENIDMSKCFLIPGKKEDMFSGHSNECNIPKKVVC